VNSEEDFFLNYSLFTIKIMSQESFEQFRSVVLEDLPLQERLRVFSERDEFVARVVEAGAERGLRFTAEDVAEAMRASRRGWIERWI
jgi:hypothetical protein